MKDKKAAIRVVARDHQGMMVAGVGREVQAFEAKVIEAMAVKKSNEIGKEKGLLENRSGK